MGIQTIFPNLLGSPPRWARCTRRQLSSRFSVYSARRWFDTSHSTSPKRLLNRLDLQQQQQRLIRVYAHLAFLAALLVTVAGFLAGVSYFLLSVRDIPNVMAVVVHLSHQPPGRSYPPVYHLVDKWKIKIQIYICQCNHLLLITSINTLRQRGEPWPVTNLSAAEAQECACCLSPSHNL